MNEDRKNRILDEAYENLASTSELRYTEPREPVEEDAIEKWRQRNVPRQSRSRLDTPVEDMIAAAIAEESARVDASIQSAMAAVGEALGNDQRDRDRTIARIKAELDGAVEKIRAIDAERRNQSEKLFILLAELRADVTELRQTMLDLSKRGPGSVVPLPTARRLDG